MKYTIIIPTYNHCDDLLKPCLESIFRYTDMQDVELLVSANGCTDNTKEYLDQLTYQFDSLGFKKNFRVFWSDKPLGYAGANNVAIEQAVGEKIILLNNDVILLEQPKNLWLEMLDRQFQINPHCGISCLVKEFSPPANVHFAVFFCVMIAREVFDKIGLLNTVYGAGAGEDTEFCIEAERAGYEVCQVDGVALDNVANWWTGSFPLYHKGEGTYHDKVLFPDWNNIFFQNGMTLAKKYNPEYYKLQLCNNFERAVFLKGDTIDPREVARYNWAAENLIGIQVLEIGCSTGFGVQFLPNNILYTGLDYDARIVSVAQEQNWRENCQFVNADINNCELGQFDTIIAFEVIEHLDNGLEIVEKLKKHCKRLLITTPYKEPPGFWGQHHRLHGLDESHFPGFDIVYIHHDGAVSNTPDPENYNLMMCLYDSQ